MSQRTKMNPGTPPPSGPPAKAAAASPGFRPIGIAAVAAAAMPRTARKKVVEREVPPCLRKDKIEA